MSRLSQMIAVEVRRRERSEPDLAREFGWSKQAFSTWKSGAVPRQQFYERIARFLNISVDELAMLAEEAKESTGNTKIPNLGSALMGIGSADGISIEKFPVGYARPEIGGCYAIRVDGRHLWINPALVPAPGNTVLVREGAKARMATWPTNTQDEVHVVVLAEMV